MRWICSSFILALALALPAAAADSGRPNLHGRTRVIDGDTLEVGGVRVRIFGIDAPEHDQTCPRNDDSRWACGTWATKQMQARFGGKELRCAPKDRDRYGRIVAICRDADGTDIGAALTGAGAAMAYRRYSLDYTAIEQQARSARRGIWAGPVTAPSDFRAAQAATRADTSALAAIPSDACAIKGNISGLGRIYHSPGQRDYDRTRIKTAAGERWFCSAAEARAAGWRPARR